MDKANHQTRGLIWELYSMGFTNDQIQKETSATTGHIEYVVDQFKRAEKKIAKDNENKVFWDNYYNALMNNKAPYPSFVLLTHNKEVLTFAKQLGFIE